MTNKTTTIDFPIPTRFEDEYPEEATVLMEICSSKTLRDAVKIGEASFPASDRIYSTGFSLYEGTSYHRSMPKINRNSLCPCGSGKKYKKCCLLIT